MHSRFCVAALTTVNLSHTDDDVQNHLDVQTVDALGDALEDFDGGLVLVSHDRRLLRDTCTEFYSVTKTGKFKALDDGVAQYVKSVAKGLAIQLDISAQ